MADDGHTLDAQVLTPEGEVFSGDLKQLSTRVEFDVPASLLNREIDRRVEEFVRRLMEQGMDPMKANLNWQDFRERQRQPAEETVKSTLVLDEIARRESIDVTEEDLAKEIDQFAERSGRTAAAVRARLEKEDGLARVASGVRREKTMAWILEKVNVI